MTKSRLFLSAAVAIGAALSALAAHAQEVTLKLHQFLPAQSAVPAHILDPWADAIETDSGGRIRIERYPSMQLGGKPPELIDQVRDGVVDFVWTLPGYTPGRFPRMEVVELPFMMNDAESTSRALWSLFESDMKDTEFKDYHVIGVWVHGPGVIHSREPIPSIEAMRGKKLRAPTRIVTSLLSELGATAVGMPVPALPEQLSKGVIDGAVIPWEVTSSVKVHELVRNHTEFGGDRALYTAAFVLAMNKARYESLPDDLKAVIDRHSGLDFSANAGKTQQGDDAPARVVAAQAGNSIVTLDTAEVDKWKAAAEPVRAKWIAEMAERGIDGQSLFDRATALIGAKGGQ
ncbi:MAG: TRAP transporter substrate-binding protein [Rhizobiaceae bacterium]